MLGILTNPRRRFWFWSAMNSSSISNIIALVIPTTFLWPTSHIPSHLRLQQESERERQAVNSFGSKNQKQDHLNFYLLSRGGAVEPRLIR